MGGCPVIQSIKSHGLGTGLEELLSQGSRLAGEEGDIGTENHIRGLNIPMLKKLCLPKIQIYLGLLYFYMLNPAFVT